MSESSRWSTRQILIRAVLVILAGAGIYLLTVYRPTPESFYPKCLSYVLTNTHCPGCGTARSLHALLNGHLQQAVAYNPMLVALPVFAAAVWLWKLRTWHRDGQIRRLRPWMILVIFWCIVLYWISRNLPWYPFVLLAPHEI